MVLVGPTVVLAVSSLFEALDCCDTDLCSGEEEEEALSILSMMSCTDLLLSPSSSSSFFSSRRETNSSLLQLDRDSSGPLDNAPSAKPIMSLTHWSSTSTSVTLRKRIELLPKRSEAPSWLSWDRCVIWLVLLIPLRWWETEGTVVVVTVLFPSSSSHKLSLSTTTSEEEEDPS